jgi:transglutaminase-like putative cysteine protease
MTATVQSGRRASAAAGSLPGAPDSGAPGPGWRFAAFATALVLSSAAELPLLRLLGRPGIHLIVIAAVPAGVVAGATRTWLGRLRRDPRSPFPVIAGFVAGLVAGTLPGMLLAAPDPFGPAALGPRLVDAVTDGWRRLLSVPVPVPDTRSFTDLPVLLAAALAAVIMLVALGDRPALALVPATAGFGGLLALGVNGPGSAALMVGCYALSALLFLLVGARSAGTARLGAAVISVVTAFAAAVAGVVAVHTGPPYDPRSVMRLPLSIKVMQDPLALLPARLETPGVPVLTAELSGALASHPRKWVALAYEDYTGGGWRVSGSARPAAAVLPGAGAAGTSSATVTLAASGVLLPHPATVTATLPQDLGYDPDADMLVTPRAISRYSVQVSNTAPNSAALQAAAVPAGGAVLTQVPSCTPAAVRRLAAQSARSASRPYARAARLQGMLKAGPFRYDQAAPPGESCGNISHFLASHRGTSSQFATAFVLAARLMGLPARVVAGYLPGKLAGHTETVTDGDAYAWPQVLFAGVGWVDFSPAPPAGSATPPKTEQRRQRPHKQKVITPGRPTSPAVPPSAAGKSHAGAAAQAIPAWVLLTAGVAALVLAWLAAVFIISARRRRRGRLAREPAVCVLGAWDELLIPLRQAGVSVHGRSAPGVAQAAASLVPEERHSVGQLAVLAERALYGETGEQDAVVAWQLSDHARAAVTRAGGRRAWLRRLFVPPRRGS